MKNYNCKNCKNYMLFNEKCMNEVIRGCVCMHYEPINEMTSFSLIKNN